MAETTDDWITKRFVQIALALLVAFLGWIGTSVFSQSVELSRINANMANMQIQLEHISATRVDVANNKNTIIEINASVKALDKRVDRIEKGLGK